MGMRVSLKTLELSVELVSTLRLTLTLTYKDFIKNS